jgi:anti-anti-sigma regulatory factor
MWQVERNGAVRVVRHIVPQNPNILEPEQTWVRLDALVGEQPTGSWVVDVSGERVLTSEALAVIVGMVRRAQASGGRISFAGCSAGVVNVLTSMRLVKMIPLFPDVPAAVAAVST